MLQTLSPITTLKPIQERFAMSDSERAVAHHISPSELQASIREHLEHLLNVEARQANLFSSNTIFNYGLSNANLNLIANSRTKKEFSQVIQHLIQQFEPRLKNVNVHIVDGEHAFKQVIHIRIEADMLVKPDPLPTLFESDYNLLRHSFTVNQ